APGEYVDFSGDKNISVSHDGTKVQVELNKNIDVNYVQTNALNSKYNLSVGTMAENGIMPFLVNSTGAFYAANNNFSVDKEGKVIATAGEIGNVVLQNGVYTGNSALRDGELYLGDASGNYSQITPKSAKLGQVTIDEKGNMAGVNSIQTNALNAKYNLSVGTMAENGIMPFLVNSTGAFYAANNNFSVDKDGKVIATAGEIGNVVLQNGVYTGNSALRDGELYLGDASGNYSQITTTGAKLGQVTIAADGKISGVAAGEVSSTSTDAINGSQLHAVATEAGKHTTLSNGKNTTVESTVKDGQTDYKVNVAGDLTDITSVANGDSKINLNKDSIIISNGNKYFAITNSGIGMSYIGADYSAKSIMLGENGTTISGGLNVAGSKITGVAAGVADTDAVNVGQLNAAVQAGNTDTHIKAGEYGVGADNKVNMDVVDKNGNKVDTVTIKDVAKASDVGNVNNIADDIKNGEGHTTVVDAVNNLNNKVGDLQYSKVEKGDIADGDSTTTAIGKLDQKLTDVAATAAKHTKVEGGNNITVTNTAQEGEAANYKVELNKDIDVDTVTANSVTTGQTVMNNDGLKVGENVSVTGTAVTAGQASISNEGLAVGPNTSLKADELKVDGKNYIDKDGLNANGQHITNVKAGEADTDAVNYGQLKDTNNHIDRVENQVVNNTNRISNLDNRVNKVGAGAAALAALHPLDFDPDAKWDFAAGYGNYRGANAAAVGAYYRPNEDTMFSVGGTFGNGENMVNAGVSFKLGSGSSHVSTSRVAMAKEIKELRGELEAMKSAMLDANAGKKIDTSKLQLFPDVPQNHWAYEYVAQLAGNGMIEGYPDGNFAGDRPMTRYEFAAILYRAMTKGAVLSDKILSEFSHELEYFTVDTIAKDKAGNPTIQRVRTVKENKNK
ncbi:S-layer homology domain-containing protein, partial [Megasphaera elsdenii]|uniref:S-layer homology domain-containing protein n=1 Tax=Megasphaera elsdenii TaxID=907 RepID=UPI003D0672CD